MNSALQFILVCAALFAGLVFGLRRRNSKPRDEFAALRKAWQEINAGRERVTLAAVYRQPAGELELVVERNGRRLRISVGAQLAQSLLDDDVDPGKLQFLHGRAAELFRNEAEGFAEVAQKGKGTP